MGKTKRKFNSMYNKYKQSFKGPLENVGKVIRLDFSDRDFINLFKEMYPYMWEDLNKKNITMVNREKGSGARILLDSKLQSLNLSTNISGYENEETSHLAVASYIARKKADVGIGNEKVSKQVDNIDFIPLQRERYDLVIRKSYLEKPIFKVIMDLISSNEFKNEIEGLGGYDLKDIGKIISET